MAEKKRILECDFSHFQIHSMDHLPRQYRRLLLGQHDEEDCEDPCPEFKFIPGFIPPSKFAALVVPSVAALVGVIIFVASGCNNPILLILYFAVAFQVTCKFRPTIFQPIPEDWRGGYYLVAEDALLKFHPEREMLWLIPIRNIVNVEHYEPHEVEFEPEDFLGTEVHNTILTLKSRCKAETFDFPIFDLVKREQGKEIVKWYQKCTHSDEDEVCPIIQSFAQVLPDESTNLLSCA